MTGSSLQTGLQAGHLRRHWLALAGRTGRLLLSPRQSTASLVQASYDRLAGGYDRTWTGHMRDLTESVLERLCPPRGAMCLDLTCGTGFAAGWVQQRTGGGVTGVDASDGMLTVARRNHPQVRFVQADAAQHLRATPKESLDAVTCCWGLGYSRPLAIIQGAARALRPGGRLAIIDNSLFSLAEVLWVSALAFAESPASLSHAMRVRFLPGLWALTTLLRAAGLSVVWQDAGRRSYDAPTGQAAIERLRATGAAAGFEFACEQVDAERIFSRFAELLERRAGGGDIRITHRYIAAIGEKPQ